MVYFIRYLYDEYVDVFVAWLFITLAVPEPPGDHPAEAGGVLLGAEILGGDVLLHHAPVPQRQQPAGAGPGEGRGLGAGAVLVPGTRRSSWSGHGPQLHCHLVIVVEGVALEAGDGVVAARILGL